MDLNRRFFDDWFEESDRDKMSMLDSCKRGNLNEVAKFLMQGVKVDEDDDDGVTALQIAAAKGHRSLVEFLLRKGAKVDRANYAGMTPFLHACREGHQDVVILLANQGANIHGTTGLGVSAMTLACAGRHLAVVRTLKSLNVAVDPRQSSISHHQIAPNPYMVAFFQMDIQICGFLKQQNANVWHQIANLDGLDVTRLGQLLGLPEMLIRLNYSENTLRMPEGKKDIRLAIQQGEDQILAEMLQNGEVPVSIQDGLSPLMFAAVSGQIRIAEMFLQVGKGGAIDAQENVLGMTALMFAIVAGESQMVQLLLRHGANCRIFSTTREPFFALDLAIFADISRECVEQLCLNWLRNGKRPQGKMEANKNGENQKEKGVEGKKEGDGILAIGSNQSRGAITPARLRRVFESIGKNLMGLAAEEGSSVHSAFGQFGWAAELGAQIGGGMVGVGGRRPRLASLADSSSAILEGPPRFVLAEHILRGDARPPGGPKRASADNLIIMARQMAINWMGKGHSLMPIPSNNGHYRRIGGGADEDRESDGLYSAAQRNAEKELKKERHRYEPATRKSSLRTPLTPRVVKSAQVQKSPSIDPQRTMRKAPHRMSGGGGGHFRAASGGSLSSQFAALPSDSPRTSPNNPRQNLFLQPPRFPQPLTKEFVKSKLREWHLVDKFEQYFGAEEVDELTFASLRTEEIRQVLVCQQKRNSSENNAELCLRFVGLIQEIKRCTASSELL